MYPISVIIPVYNEERAIVMVIDELKRILSVNKIQFELIAVNDGSNDNSREILNNIKDITVIHHPYNKGYGAALKTGIKHSKYDYVCIIDADNTYPIDAIPDMHKYLNEYDMVVGARIGLAVDIPSMRKFAKLFLTKLANYLVGSNIPDLNSGLRIFKKEAAIINMNILPSGFSFTTTITCAMMSSDYFVKFFPINYYQRTGESKIRPFHAFEFLLLVIRLIVYFKPLKIFAPAALACFLLGFFRALYTIIRDNWKITELSVMMLISALMIFLIGLLADMFVKSRTAK